MSIRMLMFALFISSLVAGCHHGGVYDSTPSAVARAMRDDFGERSCRGARGIDLGEGRWEVRGCGRDVVYSCAPGHRQPCVLERSELVADVAGGEEQPLDGSEVGAVSTQRSAPRGGRASVDPELLAQLDALTVERERHQTGAVVGSMVPGALGLAAGLGWFLYESLRGYRFSFGCWSPSGCGEPPPRTLFPNPGVQGAAVGIAGAGAIALVAGAIVLAQDGARRGAVEGELSEACAQVSAGAAGALAGLTFQTCFP